ncbi:MAG: flavodoxin domain-containing protein [Candidatus Thorarchaeota archaeon]|jgi:flavodoxin
MKKAIIVFESKYGNTKRLAELIIEGIEQTGDIECALKSISDIHTTDLCNYDMILFGCPNHGQASINKLEQPLIHTQAETRELLSNSLRRKYEMHYLAYN